MQWKEEFLGNRRHKKLEPIATLLDLQCEQRSYEYNTGTNVKATEDIMGSNNVHKNWYPLKRYLVQKANEEVMLIMVLPGLKSE